jgi:hypothetical protein
VAEDGSRAGPEEETRAALVADVETAGDDAGEAPPLPAHDESALGHEEHGMAGEGGHGDDHHDAHHEDEPLGPLDWGAWGAAALGVAVAGVIAALLYLASYPA